MLYWESGIFMDIDMGPDLLSDLPLSIIESILTMLPIRDAVQTSFLSSKWRYRWASIPQLVYSDKCADMVHDKTITENRLIKFVTHSIMLHRGPIHKFKLCSSVMRNCPEIDQWILVLTWNDIREITIELGEGEWFKVPSSLYSCTKLTVLEFCRCEMDPPLSFKGFLCLKTLSLQQVLMAPDAIESLISSCPLLENLSLTYYDGLVLSIYAPNLKYLNLEGEFKEICLENSPLLEVMEITLYMNGDDILEHFEHSSDCNFVKFLGGVPDLKKLTGHVYFTKYLSIGIEQWKPVLKYNRLTIIELFEVSFEDSSEALVVLGLISNCPNLQELHISGSPNTTLVTVAGWEPVFLEAKYPSTDYKFKRLKTVNLKDICGYPNEMALMKLLLENSPVLEKMFIEPCIYVTEGKLDMLVELVRFRRISPLAEILFHRVI